ncbi:MAG: M48 family metallopeptidase [Candidatus Binataceae bacterium]
MTIRTIALLLFASVVLLMPGISRADNTAGGSASSPAAVPSPSATSAAAGLVLSPERRQKAIEYSRAGYALYFVDSAWSLAILLGILFSGASARFRDNAERISRRWLVRGALYQAQLTIVAMLLVIPLSIASHALSLHYEQSIQGWPSWAWDWTKGRLIFLVIAVLWIWLMYAVIRWSPKRWWLYLGLASVPLLILQEIVVPVFIAPLFYKFVPLDASQPALVAQIERVVKHAGLDIPPERIFEMKASAKVNSVNAYVNGFGATKRIVIWDTTIAKMTPDEVLFVVGHEMGHYVLGHIVKSIIFAALENFLLLYASFAGMRWALARWGGRWRVRGVDDFASMPAFLIVFGLVAFLLTPVNAAFSRVLEHHADIFGIEVIHGVVPDPQDSAANGFQILGDVDLADPDPNAFLRFWFFDHPPINERIRFARNYDPWSKGEPPRFVR